MISGGQQQKGANCEMPRADFDLATIKAEKDVLHKARRGNDAKGALRKKNSLKIREEHANREMPRADFDLATIKAEKDVLHKARRGNDGKGACHTPRNVGIFAKMGY